MSSKIIFTTAFVCLLFASIAKVNAQQEGTINYLSSNVIVGMGTGNSDERVGNAICLFARQSLYGNCWNELGVDFARSNPFKPAPTSLLPIHLKDFIKIQSAVVGYVYVNQTTENEFFCAVVMPQRNGYCYPMAEVDKAMKSDSPYEMIGAPVEDLEEGTEI